MEKITLDYWQKELKSDVYWCQVMTMNHKGKDLDEAILNTFSFWISDIDRLKAMETREFKQAVVKSLTFMRRETNRKEALVSHSQWLKNNVK